MPIGTTVLSGATTGNGSTVLVKDLANPQKSADKTLVISGTFTGGPTVTAEISRDGGTTWVSLKDRNGTAVSSTAAEMWNINSRFDAIRGVVTGGTSPSINMYLV